MVYVQRKEYIVDAEDKVLGRLATRIAVLLRGKSKPDFAPNKDIGDFVAVKNVVKLKVSGRKLEQKSYFRHSGYLGGVKKTPMKKVFAIDPGEVLKTAVFGMLPKNKLRNRQIKRLRMIK
ncbi:MAG: 50S ribosomal protein L13 [Candidatus Wildermuthbacteria bacterium RIFCSPLOWO2_12_FULL_40_9]|uniref:Large ribosomal subunit protein uL13 n=2 Tax=Candidatus Wildermuthiibacteriota TaxID=1817923 RepID=A0A1G2RF78_9BACT|nr:MAG: 50S ribosomal protein L13 [Candidatus Wildermuthbacteria bacterium RIFCSPHIGHO2_12_FULL_40_12]OHA76654.1 MAG: 50S ribosomal protein L13 [Candidatus Wildermuthbacteria bacterium RIFCSPLOWO2_12_FULL_40_9]